MAANATMREFFGTFSHMTSLALFAFLVSLVATLLVRRLALRWHTPYAQDASQRLHVGYVPRLGGLGVFAGWVCALAALPLLQRLGMAGNIDLARLALPWWAAALLPAFTGGVLEDLTQRLTARWRLLLTLVSGLLAWALLGAQVPRLGFGWLDGYWSAAPWLGVALAVFAVTGLPHAFNLIDGVNGLAGTVALVVCLALAHVAIQLGDRELASIAIALAAATAGFLFWNYPRGLVFAGDSGAYLWGLVIAMLSVLLVQRHPGVSPWFPVLVLMYPVWETIFSIYRKLARGDSPGMADALHLHQLIYRRLACSVLQEDEAAAMLKRNSRTAPYLWGFLLLTVAPAVLFWRNSAVLLAFCLLFAASYVAAYLSLVHFKAQRVFGRRSDS